MRGTLPLQSNPAKDGGIIPAYAGNTTEPRINPLQPRDHPRVCGEHWLSKSRHAALTGSSPRMRGTPTITPTGTAVEGIIPAYAGNTKPV